ncbi:MAG: hypothetical protein KKC46_02420 [Proteobacteria bacterium]|nr:hypothetical protein [Pseudomonadota bacterium]
MENRFYVLDFDGVICDSRAECMITSFNAYNRFNHSKQKKVFTWECIPEFQRELFFKYRYLARVAKEFKLLWDLILNGHSIDVNLPLGEQADDDETQLNFYHTLFYDERSFWMGSDIGSWLQHNPLYPGIAQKITSLQNQHSFGIISAKDSYSIATILQANSVSIDKNKIFGSEAGDKPGHFRTLRLSNTEDNIIFIDDNLDNLLLVQSLVTTPYLSLWGYNSQRCVELAQEYRIKTLSQEEFLHMD